MFLELTQNFKNVKFLTLELCLKKFLVYPYKNSILEKLQNL
jgi:hypothetical protein